MTVYALADDMTAALGGKVDKETGRSLMTADEHTKLNGIEAGAQVNTVTGVKGNAENNYRTGEINISPANIGLGNVDNTSDADKPISTATQTALAGKAAVSHAHDDRYYTETEIDNKLGEKSNTGHTHDDRYYTEDETDTLLSGKADSSDIPDVSSFITKAVNDLTNYYTKSETYTQSEIDNMVSAIPKFAIEVVQALPSQDISPTTVYLLTVQSGQQGNMYDEYIHVDNSWELLGTQTVDLSGYYTSVQVDALLSGLPVSGHTHDERYYTESEIDGKIQTINTAISGKAASDHTHDDRYYTETEIDNKLSEKSNTGHSHVQSDIIGLDSALAGKQNALTAGTNITIETVNDALTISATDTTYSDATQQTHGLMSIADKTKLDGVQIGAQANQNAFANVKVGSTTVAADAKQDTLELVAGSNVTLTPDATNDKVTFSATDTTYSAGSGLSMSGTTINHSNSVTAGTAKGDNNKTLTFGGTFTIPTVTFDAQGHVTGKGSTTMTMPANPNINNAVTQTATSTSENYEVLFSATADNTTRTEGARKNSNLKFNPSTGNLQTTQINGVNVGSNPKFTDTTYSAVTTSTAGLMSAADKTKLNACKKIVYLASEAAYEALNPPDPDTVYLILEETI